MRHNDLLPDIISYSSGISGCEKCRQRQHALGLLEGPWQNDLQPNVISYSSAISACGKGEQWQHALVLLQEMRHNGLPPDVISNSAAISAREKVGNGSVHTRLQCSVGCNC